jgi:hypothetical protein
MLADKVLGGESRAGTRLQATMDVAVDLVICRLVIWVERMNMELIIMA